MAHLKKLKDNIEMADKVYSIEKFRTEVRGIPKMTDEIIATLKTQLEKERNYISVLEHQWNLDRDYIQLVMKLVTELKGLRLEPLTYDGENNDEVDSFTAGYNAALEDMRDILHKYFPT